MELRDYFRLFRRGWPVVVLFTLIAVAGAGFYLAVAPKTYVATATMVLVTNEPATISDAQQGSQLTQTTAPTIAAVIDSETVLAPVSAGIDPAVSTKDLIRMVSTAARLGTSIIDITVTGSNARTTAEIANLTAEGAISEVGRLDGTSASSAAPPMRLEQIAGASIPDTPESPDIKGVLLIGVIIGLALGIGVAVLRHALDTRIHYAEDLRRSFDPPLLASIPRIGRNGGRRAKEEAADTFGAAGEGFRTLRTNLGYLESTDRHCFALAAAGDDRDGAPTAISLALSFAEAGRRTLLIDCDLRRDSVGEALSLDHGVGLADLLGGLVELEPVTRTTNHPKLNVILSGTPQRSPSDLLSSSTMAALLQEVESDYDDVILHAPSLRGASDAAVVARVAGWTIITVAAGRSTARQLDDAIGALERVHVTPVGVVLIGKRASKGVTIPVG
jgi:capsular exopolysaccharide synthesis family protein